MRAQATFGRYAGPGVGNETVAAARKAIAVAPDYALGHATLAETLAHDFMRSGGNNPAMASEGLQHAERALVLSPSDPRVIGHAAITMCILGRWQDGLLHARRAVDLNPNLSVTQMALGMLSIRAQRPDDAVHSFEIAERLSPRGIHAFMALGMRGLAHFQAGRYEQALDAAERAYLINPR
jgi:tetratricopeptide (TPR) repeat protein